MGEAEAPDREAARPVANVFVKAGAAVARATASGVWERHRYYTRRYWRWLTALVVVTVIGALLGGLVFTGWWSVLSSLVFGLVTFGLGLKAIERVVEIEHSGRTP